MPRVQSRSGFTVLPWVAVAVIIAIVTAIRIRLMTAPLERDEGEFAYAAQLLLHGLSPYQHAYNAMLKLPGTCAAYAVFMAAFGETAVAIRAGVILLCAATAWFVFAITRRVCGTGGAVVATSTYAVLSISPVMHGLAAHASHFIMLPALAATWLLQSMPDQHRARRLIAAGLLLGIATMMKQSGAAFAAFAVSWVIWSGARRDRSWCGVAKSVSWLAAGGASVIAALGITLLASNDFVQFRFWTIEYARAHTSIIGGAAVSQFALASITEQFRSAPILWTVALLGALLLWTRPQFKERRAFVCWFTLWSCAAVCPGWYFRGHYFLQMLPAVALLSGVAFAAAAHAVRGTKVAVVVLVITSIAIEANALLKWKRIYFELSPAEAWRAMYGPNPFVEAEAVGRFFARSSPSDGQIAVIGSEPEIYFYSRRRAATGYICTYPLVEEQRYAAAMRTQMIREVEEADPAYVVFVNVDTSWAQTPGPPDQSIFQWFAQYQRDRLRLIGAAEVLPNNEIVLRWFDDADDRPALPESYTLAVFRRVNL